ncbi:enoyl-CoA hydratase/isomerase family protein [Modestobacter sp. I12A-02628]|uniref:Enoyl-CoA hydratase/isomerase family protein n=1 Tax=Goekera deserti TaxID=2497753 RepID=A0A7K3WDD6_9ACTN|nr:enoyl-CoA hydratase/isomerase family protein [Goekera deserti]MPQ98363.1 enoyl-CoA hydratase/isomerase family protein [Goekera deserti]NDI48190.1 enoyl-CoA hydratase/isomerase family protein [Goekera deserti]NEL53939.1 enoyl-CoA hydratase/isomerase family protein [Goekera deserti]
MRTADLTTAVDGHVAVLTVDRAAKRNAMTSAMWAAVPALLDELAADPRVRVLLVTGAGPSFCAGADIAELLGGPDPADPMAELRAHNLAAQAALRAFPTPTIAVVRGHCIGGGIELAASCDLRFTDDTGVFGVTPAKVGVVYAPAPTRALIDLVGPATAKYLLFSGELLDAAEALRTGLVDRLLPAADLDAEVRRFADVLATRSALSQRATKEIVGELMAGRDAGPVAAGWFTETIASGELAEGVAAFAGRRPPAFGWTGR